MRLINVKTRHFEEFFDQNIPPYAILSHTWDGVEVPFKDYYNPERQTLYSKQANDKIEKTCEKAKEDGYGYVWIDSCTIDKSSSAELSEAINSMYKWYEGAERCYIYLSDLALDTDTLQHTLQELIAPQDARFFDQNWHELGSRSQLSNVLSEITNIPISILDPPTFRPALRLYSVAQRMSWASKRYTTRSEDIAYCLFGVFDVNLPLLYGEGGRKAFMRLQEQIMKDTNDLSLFAWKEQCHHGANHECHECHRDDYRLRGILAKSPDEFADAASIRVSKGIANPHFTMTNKGLRIAPTLIQTPSNKLRPGSTTFMLLNCFEEVPPVAESALAIEIRDYRGTFLRSSPRLLFYPHHIDRLKEDSPAIFISKEGEYIDAGVSVSGARVYAEI